MISEDDAKTLIDGHLSSIGWDITDFNTVRKNWSISRLFPSVSIPTDEGRKRPYYRDFWFVFDIHSTYFSSV